MQNYDNDNYELSYNTLLSEITSYLSSFSHISLSLNIVKDAHKILLQFPNADSSAFYKMDAETFEFSLHSYSPETTIFDYESIFEEISRSGSIGTALQSGRFFATFNSILNKYHFILPIYSTKSIIGFFIITSNSNFNELSLNYLNLLIIFSRSFGSIVENKELWIKQNQTSDLLDQLIASRTIELVENNQALGEKIESLKSNLSMSVPHEVRTPINEILGMTNYLTSIITQYENVDDEDKGEVLEIVDDIKSSANRLKNLFENFIYHTRLSIISTSIKEIEMIQAKVSPYCESIILEQAYLKAQAHGREDDIIANLASAHVKIGEEYLAKLVDELVDNALKYTAKGDKINIYSSLESHNYSLTIYDTGQGIPPEFLDQMDAYIQFERHKNEQQGLGLGLAIVFKIVDLHNGTIEIDSKVDQYTKVTVKLLVSENYQFD